MDTETVHGFRRGDPAAVRQVLRSHGSSLYRIARRLTGHEQDAEDVLQECLTIAYTRIHELRDPEAFGPWLRRITVNASLMRLRSRRREPESLADLPEPLPGDRQGLISAHWTPQPEERLISAESRQAISDAVQRLPDGARVVYVLAEIEELSHAETASLLGISEGAVRARLHRARLYLREALTGYFAERHPTHKEGRR
ncbi:RNA polymerase sigma factor [Streptomyces sp. O3]